MSKKWSSDIMFPTDSGYVARIIGATAGESKSSGNYMITLDWEVISPSEIEIAGEMVNIAGVKCKTYQVLTNFDGGVIDTTKTEASRERLKTLYTNLGLSLEGTNFENFDVEPLKGLACYVKMGSDTQQQRKTPTAADLEKAKKEGIHPSQAGQVMKHPVTGKELISFQPKITEVFAICPSVGKVEVPY